MHALIPAFSPGGGGEPDGVAGECERIGCKLLIIGSITNQNFKIQLIL
ncbi:MAG: hypothetical protein JWQ71_344 [Pedosphaera sp.]|nr:hypothetical protein [Pedosphaera sp.]